MKIVFTGGGTGGSIMPLLSVAKKVKAIRPDVELYFIGPRDGTIEFELFEGEAISSRRVFCGKFRRYFSLKNVVDIFLIVLGFFQSIGIFLRMRPDVIIGSGGYVQVPVMWAGWVCGARIYIHQQDVRPSLSNILMLNVAKRITVSFEKSLARFPAHKTEWTGNPVRHIFTQPNPQRAFTGLNFDQNIPIILILGGGTGSTGLNSIVQQSLPKLIEQYQIIHCTGVGKRVAGIDHAHYRQFEFISDGIADYMAAAQVVVSRAGLSTLSELSTVSAVTLLVPLPDSHQEENALYFAEKNAAEVILQKDLSPGRFMNTLNVLATDVVRREQLSSSMGKMMKPDADSTIASLLIN
ncbi:MAG: UDP-N-acetylglucosamine--N-acetylmuramyl-(pentapeptide) pyrophosphoryl-undecaprenol N-acetylglucosamine transferase [Candidatus Kerfeldbacteria bacterium]|nr:UDP-N-acetylglucosamine--N-acetylmuramyl-(pentapeptide) pyrophosphoryl-undecaprenol N-acetylglucosamine transferase [Candidatus Kerfeldbacteria bacterium]